MDKKEYQKLYMRKRRMSPEIKKRERVRDNAYKLMKRRTDPEWLARERARRREYGKVNRYRNHEKDLAQRKKYSHDPINKIKELARRAIKEAVENKIIIRPKECEKCGELPKSLKNKRYPLRADHYKGYEKENWLTVQWICLECDGKQLRSNKPLVTT